MLRLIGILTGAVLASAFLIVALGVPEFATPETEVISEPALEMAAQPEPVAEPEPEAVVEPAPEPEPAPIADENWYAFWSPFRSELAANGFVSKLQESTGIDYRVVKIKAGLYEVAFAYSDDKDIEDKLARISAATGLDMSDS